MDITAPDARWQAIDDQCAEGRFLDAYRTGEEAFGPPEGWTTERGGPLASRITAHLGAPQRSDAIDLRLHRLHPREPWAFARYLAVVLSRRGPLEALRRLEGFAAAAGAGAEGAVALDRVHLAVRVALRDFDTAEEILRRQQERGPAAAWMVQDRAELWQAQDRYDEAIAALEAGLESFGGDLRLRVTLGSVRQVAGQGERAREDFALALRRAQSVPLALRHAGLLLELERPDQAQAALDAIEAPHAEAPVRSSLAGLRSEAAYKRGDRAAAVAEARRAATPFLDRLAARLESPAGERRALLPVPFVRQHHRTCAPATLAAIARHWEQPADHLEIADAICYDGTPDHAKRRWADEHGWRAREFTVTWDAARELLERGVPFALTTVEAHGAHLQAVVGFDEARGTLLVRDPTVPVLLEADAEALFEHYRSVGPRGMAMVPGAEASRLDGLALPDAELHDLTHELQLALDAHRRPDALAARARLQERAPGHALAHWADVALATYDRDHAALLRAAERLLELFPGDIMAELMALRSLRAVGSRAERLERLERAVGRRDRAHPIFAEELAAELLADAREHDRAGRLLRRCARALPSRGRTVALLGQLASAAGQPDEAASRLRLASCLDQADEELASRSFVQAQATGRATAELARLRGRHERLGPRSPAATVTYAWALERAGEPRAARDALEATLAAHPSDGDLLRTAARWLGASGQPARAAELLARAEPLSRRVDWLETAAELDLRRGEPARSLERWREVLDLEPLSEGAQSAYVRLLEATGQPADARAFLDRLVERFPHHAGLAVLRASTLADDAPRHEATLAQIAAAFPDHPWAHRELALRRAEQGQIDEARAALARAQALDARSAPALLTEAAVQAAAGDRPAARAALRQALAWHPDETRALPRLLELLDAADEPAEVLAFARDAIARGSLSGAGVVAWHMAARIYAPDLLDAGSAALLEARPDLIVAWGERVETLLGRGEVDAAAEVLGRAVDRFPLDARLACGQAEVAAARGDGDAEIEHLERACALDPELPFAPLRLAARLAAAGRLAGARERLERALASSPSEVAFTLELSRLEQRAGDTPAAAARLERLLRQAPQHLDAWSLLQQLDRPEPLLAAWRLADEIAAALPRHPEAHLARARLAVVRGELPEALRSLDRLEELTPHSVAACELRMQVLHRLGRADEALALAAPERWAGAAPLPLSGRAADLLATAGQVDEAVARMRPLLARHPGYAWGWSKLRTWSNALGDPHGALAAARQLVRLDPRSAEAHDMLGDSLDDVGAIDEACDAVARSLQLDPLRPHAAYFLGFLELRRDGLAGAEDALAQLAAGRPVDPARVALMVDSLEAALAAACGQADRACQALARLAARPDVAPPLLVRARKALLEAGMSAEAQRALTAALGQPGAPSTAADLWLGTERARGRWDDRRLDEFLGQPAFEPLLRAEMKQRAGRQDPRALASLLDRHDDVIARSSPLWLAAAQAAALCWSPLRAALRLRRLDLHPDVALDASVDYALSLRALGLGRRARAVHARFAGSSGHWTTPHHHLWLALDTALAGNPRRAARHLAALDDLDCDYFPDQIRQLTRQAIAYWRLPPGERRLALTAIDSDLAGLRDHDPPLSPLHRRVLDRVRAEFTDRLAHGVDGLAALLWTCEQRPLGPILLVLWISFAAALLPAHTEAVPWLGAALVALVLWFFRRPLLASL